MRIEPRPLGEGDLEQMWALEREGFDADPVHEDWWTRSVRATGFDRWHGLFAAGRLAAMACVLPFRQWFGGRSIAMGGVAAVAVRPEFRGHGCAARLLDAALEAMRARGEAISALFPSVIPPYRRAGWELAGVVTYHTVPTAALAMLDAADLPLRRGGAADIDLVAGCYARVAQAHNGLLDRPEGAWRWFFDRYSEDLLFLAGDLGYVLYGHERPPGAPSGVYHLAVRELVAETPDALRALWTMLGRPTSPFVPAVTFRGAPLDPLALLLRTPDVVLSRQRRWMLRLVDAPAAMAARGYPAGARAAVPLTIDDGACAANAGRFTLVVEDGRGRLEPGGSGAIRVGVGALASCYTGYTTTATLARAGLLAGGSDAERAALDALFAGPTPWMLNEF